MYNSSADMPRPSGVGLFIFADAVHVAICQWVLPCQICALAGCIFNLRPFSGHEPDMNDNPPKTADRGRFMRGVEI